MSKPEKPFWVGRLRDDDDMLVYDKHAQNAMPDFVRLFSVEQRGWRKFKVELVRRHLEAIHDPVACRMAIDAYDEFDRAETARRAEEAAAAAAEARAWVEQRQDRQRDRTMELNRDFLADKGVAETGYRRRNATLAEREAYCWRCRKLLDSRQDLEHVGCGWMVCSCGACGCGFQPEAR